MIAPQKISENLLFLRRFADAGFSIYLDDKTLKVYDKITNNVILNGAYVKPNCTVFFSKYGKIKKYSDRVECDNYRSKAGLAAHQGLPSQSQTDDPEKELRDSEEVELKERSDDLKFATGREGEGKLDDVSLEVVPRF